MSALARLLDPLRRWDDPVTSRDPAVRGVVAALGTLALPAPRAAFQAELRAQLVAVAPRVVAEAAEQAPATPAAAATGSGWRRRLPVGRVVRLAAALAVLAALLLGTGVWASQRALPGDALYSLKRGWESVRLSFTHGTDRGRTYLKYSTHRANEVSGLVQHSTAAGRGVLASGVPTAHTVKLINATLNAADTDLRTGNHILAGEADHQRSAAPLQFLISWAPNQHSLLHSIQSHLPAGTAQDRVTASLTALEVLTARARALASIAGCGCFTTLPSDSAGPLPPGVTPSGTLHPTPSDHNTHPAPIGSGSGSGSGGNRRSSAGNTPTGVPSGVPSLPTPTSPLSLATSVPSLPLPTSLTRVPTSLPISLPRFRAPNIGIG